MATRTTPRPTPVDPQGTPGPGTPRPNRGVSAFVARLFEPVDIASIVVFRIAFGAIMVWEVYRYFSHGWIERYWVEPSFHFTYYGFGWVEPLPGSWMKMLFAALGVLAACIMVGYLYRVATVLFFLGFTYTFLLEQARYLNHFYFVCLIAFLLIFVPAHRAFSVDAWLKPEIRSQTVARYALWLLRVQVAAVFVFAGVAKLNGDWLRGEPLRMWLAARTDFPVIGSLFTEEWLVYLFSYGGLLLDLLVVPLILWPLTRPFALGAALGFHLLNSRLFTIGIFPWFSIGATMLFLPPSWPRTLWRLIRRRAREPAEDRPAGTRRLTRFHWAVAGLVACYVLIQVLVPLRHFLYPGNVSWTEEGHQFAWHQKLRDKESDARFVAFDPRSNQQWEIDPNVQLTSWQYSKMSTRPDMILQYAHHVARDLRAQGYSDVEIHALVWVSLNGRKPALLVDPDVDLAAEKRSALGGADWVLPLHEPLPG
jgi:vitamin K-dependent gamma-carboxylase-like protein